MRIGRNSDSSETRAHLPNALKLIAELQAQKSLPPWMSSLVEKAKRWSGDSAIPQDNDFSEMNPSPAVFAEERTKLRKLLVDRLKAKDIDATKKVAIRLYNLALLVAYLYGDHDCNSAVAGAAYDAALKQMRNIADKFNFHFLGTIQDAKFLSPTDYSRLRKVFGTQLSRPTLGQVKELI